MNLRKKVTSVAAVFIIALSMFGGAAAAITDSKTKTTELDVTCASTSKIDLQINDVFTLNTTDGDAGVDPLPGAFVFELDLTCNWSTDFQVNAEISDFVHENWQSNVGTNQATSFDGGRLTLTNGARNYNGVIGVVGGILPTYTAGAPDYSSTVFAGNTSYTDGAIEDGSINVVIGPVVLPITAKASPGVTTVTYTGNLDTSGLMLAQGTYEADLTLELIVN